MSLVSQKFSMGVQYPGNTACGIVLLDKSLNLSSNHALQRVKRLLKAKKAGHTGTLDPLATGMLPICLGAATKFSQYFLDDDKTYEFSVQLGVTTTTGDLEGDVVRRRQLPKLDTDDLQAVIAAFVGPIQQVPPMYSALKHNGKPLYEYARAGIDVERPARSIVIRQLSLLGFNPSNGSFSLRATCSKGTYIRSLAYDIGEIIGCGAVVTKLRRVGVAAFDGLDMVTMETLEDAQHQFDDANFGSFILPLSRAFDHLPTLTLDSDRLQRLRYGQTVYVDATPVELTAVRDETGLFNGLVSVQSNGLISVCKLLPVQC